MRASDTPKLRYFWFALGVLALGLSGCRNGDLFKPMGFDAICRDVAARNKSINLGDVSSVVISHEDIAERATGIDHYCDIMCLSILLDTKVSVLVNIKVDDVKKDQEYLKLYFKNYTKKFTEDGYYKYILIDKAECTNLNSYGNRYKMRDICIDVERYRGKADFVNANIEAGRDYKTGNISYGNSFGVPYTDNVTFYRNRIKIGRMSNAYFLYPPGPSAAGCAGAKTIDVEVVDVLKRSSI